MIKAKVKERRDENFEIPKCHFEVPQCPFELPANQNSQSRPAGQIGCAG